MVALPPSQTAGGTTLNPPSGGRTTYIAVVPDAAQPSAFVAVTLSRTDSLRGMKLMAGVVDEPRIWASEVDHW